MACSARWRASSGRIMPRAFHVPAPLTCGFISSDAPLPPELVTNTRFPFASSTSPRVGAVTSGPSRASAVRRRTAALPVLTGSSDTSGR